MTDLVGIEHEGVVRDDPNADAVLFDCQDSNVWIPRSLLQDYDGEIMVIPRWLADKRRLEPDWDV